MFRWLKRTADRKRIGQQLYERIVAQARGETFYRNLGVPDTMEARFEMIVLHLVLVLDRLRPEGAEAQRLGQVVIEHLVAELDDALRQIGIGDMGVPKRVQRAAAAIVERSHDYGVVLAPDAPPAALVSVLQQHVYRADAPGAVELAAYTRRVAMALRTQPMSTIEAGQLSFPTFENVSGPVPEAQP